MKKFVIVSNPLKDSDLNMAVRVSEFLEGQGGTCLIVNKNEDMPDLDSKIADSDCIIVIGGDGSMIHVIWRFGKYDIPFVGVNMGRVGYLTEIEPENMEEYLSALINDDADYESRMMLSGYINIAGQEQIVCNSINDIVINRGEMAQVVKYMIFVNGKLLYSYNGDGVIVSTPTGSTAYSLSAGGPIVSPKAEMILITPICPQSLNSRSVVLSADDIIEIRLEDYRKGVKLNASVFSDGQKYGNMTSSDSVVIKKNKKNYRMIKINRESFMETLRKKIND